MPSRFERKDFNKDLYDNMNERDKTSYLKKAIKTANARALSLERAGYTENSAYSMMKDWARKNKKGQYRFSSSLPKTQNQRDVLAKKLSGFLNAKTSTVGGVRNWYYTNAERLKRDFGIEDPQKFKEFVKSDEYRLAEKTYASTQLFEIYKQFESEFDVEEILFVYKQINEMDVGPKQAARAARKAIKVRKKYGTNSFDD